MRARATLIAAALISTIAATAASATMRISDDVGGRIGAYVDQYSAVRDSGERVVIDGACLSACTLVLGIVPRNRICVTRNAMLGFHAAWMPGPNGKPVPSAVGTQALWDLYPQNVRRWINSRGGLSLENDVPARRGADVDVPGVPLHRVGSVVLPEPPRRQRARRSRSAPSPPSPGKRDCLTPHRPRPRSRSRTL